MVGLVDVWAGAASLKTLSMKNRIVGCRYLIRALRSPWAMRPTRRRRALVACSRACSGGVGRVIHGGVA